MRGDVVVRQLGLWPWSDSLTTPTHLHVQQHLLHFNADEKDQKDISMKKIEYEWAA